MTIDGLDEPILTATGHPIVSGSEPLTIKSAILLTLGRWKADPIRSIAAWDVSKRLAAANGTVELSDAERRIVKEALEANPCEFFTPVMAQVYQKACP